ncbi:MAG: MFS transporter [Bacteroidales bacterium]|nr:MAG: MFS transporter [Bacteroidales bacterium]
MEAIKRTLRDSALMRWIVLVLISGLTFGTYWFQDCLGPLKGLMESELGFSNSQYGLIMSSITWANLALMIIFGGILLDKWGIRLTGIVFASIATIGAIIITLASKGFFGSEPDTMLTYMIIGRLMFGTGLETICVMANRTIVKWFKGKELALALAINMVFGRLGSAGANFLGVEVANGSVSTGLSFAATLIGLGLILFLIYTVFDAKLDRQEDQSVKIGDDEKFRVSDFISLITNSSFIYITLLCVAFYSAVFPFIQIAPDLLINKYGFSTVLPDLTQMSFLEKVGAYFRNGSKVTSLIPFATMIFTPLFAIFLDRKGRAATIMIVGASLLIFAHISLSLLNSVVFGYLGLLALGIAFSLIPAAMWPSVAKIVPENRLGTAYATMFTFQNYGLAIVPVIIGKVLDIFNPEIIEKIRVVRADLSSQGFTNGQIVSKINELKTSGVIPAYDYTMSILMLVGLGIISIFLAIMLKKADRKQGYGLELVEKGK